MRPTPIAPIVIWLLGADFPNTDAGTMAGNPATTDVAAKALPADERNERRECLCRDVCAIPPLRAG
jgi:hypothetical protein